MNPTHKLFLKTILLFGCILMMTGCSATVTHTEKPNATTNTQKTQPDIGTKTETAPSYASLLAVGDNIIYNTIYWQAQQRAGKSNQYDFSYVYRNVADDIEKADIAMINQETPLASSVFPLSSYPKFNSPTAVGDELVSLGFDVVNHANNHILDQGEKGLLATISYWKTQKNVVVTGIYENKQETKDIPILIRNGIKFAFLGYTQMTNGISLNKNSNAFINYTTDEANMKQQIEKARKEADIVVISVHWGIEYQNNPTEKQTKLAQKMANWGADIIIGTHPHVIQPVTAITCKDGRKALVYYSLGNFVAHQTKIEAMMGGMADITVKKDNNTGKSIITSAKLIPLVIQADKPGGSNIRIYQFSSYTPALAQNHFLNAKGFTYAAIKKHFSDVIDHNYLP